MTCVPLSVIFSNIQQTNNNSPHDQQGVCSCRFSLAMLTDSDDHSACIVTSYTIVVSAFLLFLTLCGLLAMLWLLVALFRARQLRLSFNDAVGVSSCFTILALAFFQLSRAFRVASFFVSDRDDARNVQDGRFVSNAVMDCFLITSLSHLALVLYRICQRCVQFTSHSQRDYRDKAVVVGLLCTTSPLFVLINYLAIPSFTTGISGLFAIISFVLFRRTLNLCSRILAQQSIMNPRSIQSMVIIQHTCRRISWVLLALAVTSITFTTSVIVGQFFFIETLAADVSAIFICLFTLAKLVVLIVHAHMLVVLYSHRVCDSQRSGTNIRGVRMMSVASVTSETPPAVLSAIADGASPPTAYFPSDTEDEESNGTNDKAMADASNSNLSAESGTDF
jgi:hypothetical protein